MGLVHPLLTKTNQPCHVESLACGALACSSALLRSPLPLPCTHLPVRQVQDTARGQLGGSQEFGLQCLGAYQWAVVQPGIPELLSHIFAGNYKSPSAEPGVLQYLALCNFASSVITRVAIFALLQTFQIQALGSQKISWADSEVITSLLELLNFIKSS